MQLSPESGLRVAFEATSTPLSQSGFGLKLLCGNSLVSCFSVPAFCVLRVGVTNIIILYLFGGVWTLASGASRHHSGGHLALRDGKTLTSPPFRDSPGGWQW